MNTLTVAKLADYIAEEHHSGHLLASDLIFRRKSDNGSATRLTDMEKHKVRRQKMFIDCAKLEKF